MNYEINGYEVLSVEQFKTPTQTVIVKKHHTFYRHVTATIPNQLIALQPAQVIFTWKNWQGDPIAEEATPFTVEISEQEVSVAVGETLELVFSTPGEYILRTINPNTQNIEVVLEVIEGVS